MEMNTSSIAIDSLDGLLPSVYSPLLEKHGRKDEVIGNCDIWLMEEVALEPNPLHF